MTIASHIKHSIQELRELGLAGSLHRVMWEFKLRSGWVERRDRKSLSRSQRSPTAATGHLLPEIPFAKPEEVTESVRERMDADRIARLLETARQACEGRILCFGRWSAEFGKPVDWHLHPQSRARWPADRHWSRSLADAANVGDVKFTWEVGRFPQAYHISRAAALVAHDRKMLGDSLAEQFARFVQRNPVGRGVHWYSGLEIALRMLSWLFSCHVLHSLGIWDGVQTGLTAISLEEAAEHVDRHFEFALKAVQNDHLIGEALLLYLGGLLLPYHPLSDRWREQGRSVLTQQARSQFYDDGGYLMLSNNYHRAALQLYLWAWRFHSHFEGSPPEPWREAIDRSIQFLFAQINPDDGRLPNFGANDGALFHILSCCDFSDFRPTLQAAGVAIRGERMFPPGPWDEEAAWLFGSDAIQLDVRPPKLRSVAHRQTGIHVLRDSDPRSYALFRCGPIRDRYGHMDMLHVDLWYRGENVLVDGGSYQYNGPGDWHRHFVTTASHNTIMVGDRDQMLYWRKFKNLYWTQARLLEFTDGENWVKCVGQHYSYRRSSARCTHRRTVIATGRDLWVIVDHLDGQGRHPVLYHWLGGRYPCTYQALHGRMILDTPAGSFSITVSDEQGVPLVGDVVQGQENPPRGWQSRYYGERVPVPSLAVERTVSLPTTGVSILAGGCPKLEVKDGRWQIWHQKSLVQFWLRSGSIGELVIRELSAHEHRDEILHPDANPQLTTALVNES